MPRKTAEERAREYDDAKARQPKVLTLRGVVIPEVKNLSDKSKYRRKCEGLQGVQGFKTQHNPALPVCGDIDRLTLLKKFFYHNTKVY
jgi:hypothetical protein